MRQQRNGFTLVELIIVITVVAILAAIALPRYAAMQRDARVAKMQAVYGALRSSIAIARARCELDATLGTRAGCTATAGVVFMDGVSVNMFNKYPAPTLEGIVTAAHIDPVADGVHVRKRESALELQAENAANPAACQISYGFSAGDMTQPMVSLQTTGC